MFVYLCCPIVPHTDLPYNEESYAISIAYGTEMKPAFLTANYDGMRVHMSPWEGGQNQLWKLHLVGDNSFIVEVVGGVVPGRSLLSTSKDGKKIDLFTHDDRTGRQRWQFEWVTSPNTGEFFRLRSGDTKAGTFLSCTADGHVVDLFGRDDLSGRQRWVLMRRSPE